jgi:hypothetical protein
MVLQAISPLLRSDFAQSTAGQTPNGDLPGGRNPASKALAKAAERHPRR